MEEILGKPGTVTVAAVAAAAAHERAISFLLSANDVGRVDSERTGDRLTFPPGRSAVGGGPPVYPEGGAPPYVPELPGFDDIA